MEEIKTGYNWCLYANIRILDLNEWSFDEHLSKSPTLKEKEISYFSEKITEKDFINRITKCKVKANSMPRKTDDFLEYRMYGLVPYNISPIQQAIQYGHAVVEYGLNIQGLPPYDKMYRNWATKDKTFIILNGGTTNNSEARLGTLNRHVRTLYDNDIMHSTFFEPDLGDQLTAVVFLVDERVWNRELYSDFIEEKIPYNSRRKPSKNELTELDERNEANYQKWVDKVGGLKNVFLREFLKGFRLA